MIEVSVFRLNLLRAGYLLLVIGLGLTIWPSILDPSQTWALKSGVVVSMLGGMSALAVLGLRHPLQMLPVIFFEIAWKMIWLVRIALPLWLGNHLDAATTETVYECLGVVIFPVIIPWRYVLQTYVKQSADPWVTKQTLERDEKRFDRSSRAKTRDMFERSRELIQPLRTISASLDLVPRLRSG